MSAVETIDRRAKTMTAKLKLPSGKVVVMRELTGEDELAAAAEADKMAGGDESKRQLANSWAAQKRAIVSVDGVDYEQSERTALGFRNEFSAKDHMALQVLFSQLHGVDKDEFDGFRSAIQWEASG